MSEDTSTTPYLPAPMSTMSVRLPKDNPWATLKQRENCTTTLRYPGAEVLDIFRGINPGGEYLFMLKLPEAGNRSSSKTSLPKIDGCRAEYIFLDNYLNCCLILENTEDWRIFTMLCNLLRDELETEALSTQRSNSTLIQSFINQLLACQAFFSRRRLRSFTLQEAQGLYGELRFLRDCIMKSLPQEDWLLSWDGPLSGKQDFSALDTVVEVKTKTTTTSNAIDISSIDQLCPHSAQGFLCVNRITQDCHGESLTGIVHDIQERLPSREQQSVFSRLLDYVGYRSVDENTELYQRKWGLSARQFYAIREGFPRITINDLMPGIVPEKVRYAIDQSSLEPFKSVPSWIEH